MPDAKETLDQQMMEMRWRCLSLAADLDRIQRAPGGEHVLSSDARLIKLRDALKILLQNDPDRAGKVQLIFSDTTPPPK